MQAADFARSFHRRYHLRPRHDCDTKQLDIVFGDQVENDIDWIVIQIAVDDLIFFAAFEHGCDGQNCQGQTAVARPGGARIEEDNHAGTRSK
jgi:hypothetical protein